MSQSSLQRKKFLNLVYGLGASIVIIGALCKILHIDIGPIKGSYILGFGLITEAIIFAIAAFEPVEDDYDWTKVYPQLAGGSAKGGQESPDGMLSKKLDDMMREAKLDANTMAKLTESINNFEVASEGLSGAAKTVASTSKYNEQMAEAAKQMEELNALYKKQMDGATRQADANAEMAAHSEKLKAEMEALANNLTNLNNVYGAMLTAMNKK